jgi:hypothetical protein
MLRASALVLCLLPAFALADEMRGRRRADAATSRLTGQSISDGHRSPVAWWPQPWLWPLLGALLLAPLRAGQLDRVPVAAVNALVAASLVLWALLARASSNPHATDGDEGTGGDPCASLDLAAPSADLRTSLAVVSDEPIPGRPELRHNRRLLGRVIQGQPQAPARAPGPADPIEQPADLPCDRLGGRQQAHRLMQVQPAQRNVPRLRDLLPLTFTTRFFDDPVPRFSVGDCESSLRFATRDSFSNPAGVATQFETVGSRF